MANQIIIDIGAVANDGTGDPLRTAFGYVNNNFSNIWTTGVANSNIAFSGNKILTTNTNGNLVLAPNGIGKVQSNVDIVPNANNTLSLGSLTNQWNTVYAQNLTVAGNTSFTNLTVDGNLTVNGTTTSINTTVVDIEDKNITLAYGTANAVLANGAGITVSGANAQLTYLSSGDKWSLNKNTDVVGNLAVTSGSLAITGVLGNVWRLNGDQIESPAGGTWESVANTEYFSSGTNGYVHLNSFDAAGNIASTIEMEHSFIRFNVYNGINAQWQMNQAGTTSFPNYTFPYADGNADEILVTDGNGTLSWTVIADTYGNANVAAYLPTYNGNIGAAYINVANNINVQNDISAKRGSFNGDPVTGDASLYIGSPSFTILGTDVMAQFTGNVPSYAQLNLQNYGNSNTASGDYIITADNGTDSTHFLNLGLTGSNWDGTQPNSLGNRLGPNDGYLYVQDGNLVIGTVNGTVNAWNFGTDGNLVIPGEIQGPESTAGGVANIRGGFGTAGPGGDVYIVGGASGNGSSEFGNVIVGAGVGAWTFDNTGNLTLSNGGSIIVDGGDGVIGPDSDNMVISWDNEELILRSVGGDVDVEADNDFNIRVNYDVGATDYLTKWAFGQNNEIVNITGNSAIITEAGNLNLQGGRNTLSSGNVQITAVNNGVAVNTWTFDNTGTLTAPGNIVANWLNISNVGNTASLQANVSLQIVANAGGSAPYWVFNTDGNLQVPGSINGDNNGPLLIDGNGSGTEGYISLPASNFGGEQIAIVNKFSSGNGIRLETNGGNLFFSDTGNLTVPGNIITTAGNISSGNLITTGNVVGNVNGYEIGYRNIPQLVFAGDVQVSADDAGKHYYNGSNTSYTVSLVDSGAVTYPVGLAVTIVNKGTGNIAVNAFPGVNLYMAGSSSAGNRTVGAYGMATVLNVATDVWMINGTGVY